MRLFGIETEYGLAVEGRSAREQMEDAAALVASCPAEAFAGWDYAFESPRADIRGFEVERLTRDPADAKWDEGRPSGYEHELRSDRVLTNGARFYNDHGHPEYATPECARIADLVAHDLAGERIALAAARAYQDKIGRKVRLYKNNTDFHGASYGTHESYLVQRDTGCEELISGLLPLFVARPILTGGGKVGSEVGRSCRYQLSQRAEFFHETASVETLYRRPVFNTRDEPHADPKRWMRLHVICGDANRMPWAIAMKAAMVRLALDLIEMGEAPVWRVGNPARALAHVSKDPDMKWRIELDGGSWTTAPEVLESYLAASERLLRGRDAETDWAIGEWRVAMLDLAADPMRLKDRCDWAAKLAMLEEYADSAGGWKNEQMQALDLEYHNLDPDEGLFSALQGMGRVQTVVEEDRILDAMTVPPGETRARLRGDAVARFCDRIETIGWRRVVFNVEGESKAVELPVEPRDWTDADETVKIEEWIARIEQVQKNRTVSNVSEESH
ncbi:MAG: proteasome accessory factor PafA2 family protein [Armatimonadetes bacterium]|nr:proteasome accessory factor PafA2 family protein [Armatimonadota bacterium]